MQFEKTTARKVLDIQGLFVFSGRFFKAFAVKRTAFCHYGIGTRNLFARPRMNLFF
jgi:hypothetical protein